MVNLALLNDNNICIGVQQALGMIDDGKHVEIDTNDFDYYVYRKYENGQWSEEKYVPEAPQVELTRMEKLEQSQADQDELIMQIMLGGM
ncbi:hypothetical protein [Paenibacillus cineris]|uniref:hypothetical protein n=1 Tax=Paenibacillus cineris TaxID=237530 RepID=UPI001AFD4AE4|nr:hypothetical protein [Paenibacillus cineris]GIO63586.1 hypothetical protein J43TS9_51600 [Paenibacillus cineris]